MPLSAKGRKILRSMRSQYGEKEGTSVFYASKNKGTITGVDSQGGPWALWQSLLGDLVAGPPPSASTAAMCDAFLKRAKRMQDDMQEGSREDNPQAAFGTGDRRTRDIDPPMIREGSNWGSNPALEMSWEGGREGPIFYRTGLLDVFTKGSGIKLLRDRLRRSKGRDRIRDALGSMKGGTWGSIPATHNAEWDAAGSESSSVGAESWFGNKKNSTGYAINADAVARIRDTIRRHRQAQDDDMESGAGAEPSGTPPPGSAPGWTAGAT
jgi:hypothetical protein